MLPLATAGAIGHQRGRDHAEGTADRRGSRRTEGLELERADVAGAVSRQVEARRGRIGVRALPRKSVVGADAVQGVVDGGRGSVRPKLASRRNVAGPSEPGRGSRGATKAG